MPSKSRSGDIDCGMCKCTLLIDDLHACMYDSMYSVYLHVCICNCMYACNVSNLYSMTFLTCFDATTDINAQFGLHDLR